MRLLIISALEHYRQNGTVMAGWAPIVREFEYLSELFGEVRHLAPLHAGKAPQHARHYPPEIELVAIKPAGGPRFRDKLRLLLVAVGYTRVLIRELAQADAVFVRCPSNVGFLAVLLLTFLKRPRLRWIKYAGDWTPSSRDRLSYRLQRACLLHLPHRALVTVNSTQRTGRHIHNILNPSYSRAEWQRAAELTRRKSLSHPVRLLFVGRLDEAKGATRAAQCFLELREREHYAQLDIVGNGPEGPALDALIRNAGAEHKVRRHGWLNTADLNELYRRAHFLVLPTSSEGWPKVVSEAMAFRVVPIVGAGSCIPEFFQQTGGGVCLPPGQPALFADAIDELIRDPSQWQVIADNARIASERFTYEAHLENVRRLLALPSQPAEFPRTAVA